MNSNVEIREIFLQYHESLLLHLFYEIYCGNAPYQTSLGCTYLVRLNVGLIKKRKLIFISNGTERRVTV